MSKVKHSMFVLDRLYEYDDFMASIATLADLGCGDGADLVWWATRTTRDPVPKPLNIECTGVDLLEELTVEKQHKNITYQRTDFEGTIKADKKFDVLWCNDAFQHCLNPSATLANWYNIASDGGMLILIVKQNTSIYRNQLAFHQYNQSYYNPTLPSLMQLLALNGWDCKNGYFLKNPLEPWIYAIVYKSDIKPMDPKTTTWYDLAETNLLPESAVNGINAHGYLRQEDLILPWLDRSIMSFHLQ